MASGDTQALGNHEESFRALSLSDSSSALPPLASFFDVNLPEQQHLELSGLEDEDGTVDSEKPFQEESNPPSTEETVAPHDDASPLSAHEPPVTKPILNPSAVPFFSVNSGTSPPQDAAQDPVLLHTPCLPSQQPNINPFQVQMQLQAMQQLPLVSQQQLLAQLLVQNQLLIQQQALLQPLHPLPLSLATPLPSPTTIARSSQELTFPLRSPPPTDQPEPTPHSSEAKLQKQREALARGMSSLAKAPEPRSRSQDLSLSPQQEAPIPQNDAQNFLRPKSHPALDTPSHFSAPPPLGQVPANSGEPSRPLSAEDNRHGFLQFQQWQKQQKQQGYDSSDMLRWVNEQGGPATTSLNSDMSPRPSTEQPKVGNESRYQNVRFEAPHSDHEPRNRQLKEDRSSGSLSPKHASTAFPRQSFNKERGEEPWKPQLTVDPPAEQSWQTREKPQLTIDPPERVSGDLAALASSRSRSREEQWQKRKQFLELERGSISPATSPSPSRPEWGSLKQRSSFDSERGSTEFHCREWHTRHSHDSGDSSSHSSSSRSRLNEPWSPHREYSRKSDERLQEFMQKPRQSFDSTLDVPSGPMSVSRSRSASSSNLSSKKMGSKFNFVSTEGHAPEENEDSSTGGDPNTFQQSALQQTLLNQELLRQNLLMQVTMQMQQARQMQAALAQPGADEATINAAMAAANAAATLAAQQLQYFQTMSMQNAATSEFGSLSPLPTSPRGQDEPSKSPQRSFSGEKTKLRSQERSRGSGTHSLPRRDGNSPPSPSPSPTNAGSVPWLEAFRAAKGMDQLSLKEVVVRGWLKDLAMDQYGSRFLQRRLEAASQEHKHLAFDQLMQTGILPLCTDVFGNYVIQKFFDYSGPEHRATLATKLLGNVLQLSMQMYGCRVVQKAIELSEPPVQIQLVRELDGHVIECAEDQNGNHVVQKCLEKVAANKLDFMVNAFKGQIARLATHPYGCRVIQRLLERWGSEAAIVNELLGEHTDELCRNQYGNYVIQHLLIHGSDWQRSGIIHALLGKLFVLSKHKFASNVVENCFVYGSPQDRTALIQEVLGRHHESCLLSMVRDQYANYVVQKMIDLCDQDQLAMIVQRIKRHVPGLRKIPYGKNILTRLEKLTGTVFSGTTQLGSDAFPNNEMSSATIPFPGADNSASASLHMNPAWGHNSSTRRPDGFRSMSIGRDSRDRGCLVFSGHRPLSIETDAGGFSGIDDQFDSYYANLQADGRTEFEGEM